MTAGTLGNLETFTCSNCGATSTFDPGTKTLRCPFCGTELAVEASGAAAEAVADRYVLPFNVQKEKSQQLLREWLGGSLWAPGDLKSRSALDRGQGIYVPFWRFDADATSLWEGEVSKTHTRQVTRTRTNSEGRQERYQATEYYKTWHPRSGAHEGEHRAWVTASTGLSQLEANALMPFPEQAMMTYSSNLLVGFSAEEPGIDEDGAWVAGEKMIIEDERLACSTGVERLTRADTTLSNVRSALCFLPIWIYSYRYRQEDFRVLVNGHTGEIVGDRPTSRSKVIIAIAAAAVVIALIIVLIVLFG